jgi:3-oxoacyl-[acyl-carrier protein] reductase
MDLQLSDKVALVTGSAKGVGREIVRAFAREGACVVVNYRSSAERAEVLVEEIRDSGGRALAIQGDVTDTASIDALAARALEEWGTLDILVNNAVAFGGEIPLEEITPDQWAAQIQVTLNGAWICAARCAQPMRERGWGRIVNITSRPALMGYPRMAHYAAAKAGLIGLTRTLAKELGPAGILVNAVAPQLVLTEAMIDSLPEKVRERLSKRNPLRRLALPEDIARVVLFLGSGWNTFVNGEVITVNGGDIR